MGRYKQGKDGPSNNLTPGYMMLAIILKIIQEIISLGLSSHNSECSTKIFFTIDLSPVYHFSCLGRDIRPLFLQQRSFSNLAYTYLLAQRGATKDVRG